MRSPPHGSVHVLKTGRVHRLGVGTVEHTNQPYRYHPALRGLAGTEAALGALGVHKDAERVEFLDILPVTAGLRDVLVLFDRTGSRREQCCQDREARGRDTDSSSAQHSRRPGDQRAAVTLAPQRHNRILHSDITEYY